MSALKNGLKVAPTGGQNWLLLNQEEKELAMRPILPWHIPLQDAARKHTHTHCPFVVVVVVVIVVVVVVVEWLIIFKE